MYFRQIVCSVDAKPNRFNCSVPPCTQTDSNYPFFETPATNQMQLELEFLQNLYRKYVYKIALDADYLKPRYIFLKKNDFLVSRILNPRLTLQRIFMITY